MWGCAIYAEFIVGNRVLDQLLKTIRMDPIIHPSSVPVVGISMGQPNKIPGLDDKLDG